PPGLHHRERIGEEGRVDEAAERGGAPRREEHDEERRAQPDARARRDRDEWPQRMNRVSMIPLVSGTVLMMPSSRSSSAASLLNAWMSPAKNFLFASRSCQRRYACDFSNCSPVCFTALPMISKLCFGSL